MSNFVRAAESQGSLLINLGRYAPAESLLLEALTAAPDTDRYPLLRTLARLFRLEGRYAEVSDVLVAAWAGAPDPSRAAPGPLAERHRARPRRRLEGLP